MDRARESILEAAWRAILRRKQTSTAAIVELRAIIRRPGMDVHKVVREISEHEARLVLLDELVEEASRG